MTRRFQDQRYLITGGASGIGRATARALKREGARLALWDVSPEALEETATALEAFAAEVDVTDPTQVIEGLDAIAEELGGIDGIVHCAGIMRAGLFDDIDLEQHLATVNVNVRGTVVVAHAAMPHLRRTRGKLAMMGSISAVFGPPEFSTYGASKGFVLNLAEALSIEARDHGVRVMSVNPFFAATPMLDTNPDAALVQSVGAVHTPEEIADAILDGLLSGKRRIFPGWKPRAIWALSRYGAFAAPALMRMNWKHPAMARIWRRGDSKKSPKKDRTGA